MVFEEKKSFLGNLKLKGQFGRKVASNEIEHKYLGSSTPALKHKSRRLKRNRTRIECSHA
jgi:hypothetical protein